MSGGVERRDHVEREDDVMGGKEERGLACDGREQVDRGNLVFFFRVCLWTRVMCTS